MVRRTLLACGILFSLLYVAMNVYFPLQWPGYDAASQTISELSAVGAPTRPAWVAVGFVYSLLVIAFGWGVWSAAGARRALRIAGALIIAQGVVSLGWPLAPMHQREVLAAGGGSLTDTMHIVLGAVTVLLFIAAMGFGAAALGTRFRVFTAATLVVLVGCGALTGVEAPRMSANLATPLIGVWERVNIGAFMLWVVVLALALMRLPAIASQVEPGGSPVS